MSNGAEYRLFAFEAQRMADRTSNSTDRACWQDIANKWRALAEPQDDVIVRTVQAGNKQSRERLAHQPRSGSRA